MINHSLLAAAVVVSAPLGLLPAQERAAGTSPPAIEVRVQLGNAENQLRFFPDSFRLEAGKLHRLILINPSPQRHYFSSDRLAQAVYTRKVQVNAPGGDALAEVKGYVREIEVGAGATVEWWLVPVRTGTLADLACTVAGHAEAGMRGRIIVGAAR